MTVDKKITSRFPSNGSLPSEQTAASEMGRKPSASPMADSDKLVYRLVESNVALAGERFGENLRFNSETLTNVLYDNICKLLGEKFNEDEFAESLASQLVDSGQVTKAGDSSSPKAGSGQQQQEVVYELDDSQYAELVSKVDAAIQLLKANRLSLFKAFNGVNDQIGGLGKEDGRAKSVPDPKRVDELEKGIGDNYAAFDEHVEARDERMNRIRDFLSHWRPVAEAHSASAEKVVSGLELALKKVKAGVEEANGQVSVLSQRNFTMRVDALCTRRAAPSDRNPAKASGFSTSIKPKKEVPGFRTKAATRRPVLAKAPAKKPELGSKLVHRIMDSRAAVFAKQVKAKVDRLVSVVKDIYQKVKGVVKGVFKVAKRTVVAAYKTARFAARAFTAASFVVGSVALAGARQAVRIAKNTISSGGRNVVKFLKNFSLAKIVVKAGFGVFKWAAKKLWGGVKRLGLAFLGMLVKLFGVGVGFANKVSTYISALGKGLKDKAYTFLVKPIAEIMVTVMGFAMGMVRSHSEFAKNLIPDLIKRLRETVHGIREGTKHVLRQTWGVFKRIVSNPITIAILIGGLFALVGPKLV